MLTKLQHRSNLQTIIMGWRELVKSFLLRKDLTRTEKQQLNMIQYLLGTLLHDWEFNTRYGGCRELPPIDPQMYFHPIDWHVMVDGEWDRVIMEQQLSVPFSAIKMEHQLKSWSALSNRFTGGEA